MKVRYVDLAGQYGQQRDRILSAMDRVMASGQYILGEEVTQFEKAMGELCEVRHCIGVANGTDALVIAMQALEIGPGDEVITVANSWISTASSIFLAGATPVFVDVDEDQNLDPNLLVAAITPKTKAILPVHLTGRCAAMGPILKIAREHGLYVIEDAAQAIGATYRGQKAGSMGDIGCFSLHPLKNLNAIGDAGAITTQDDELARRINLLRNHGLEDRNNISRWGHNSRLDALQAAILCVRLEDLEQVIVRRRANARFYHQELKDIVAGPKQSSDQFDTYHLFVIQTDRRDELQAWLHGHEISTAIHYPIPNHLQPCCRELGYKLGSLPQTERQASRILSLPVHQLLTMEQLTFVVTRIKSFFEAGS